MSSPPVEKRIQKILEDRMLSGEEFTLQTLCTIAMEAGGNWRHAERAIQRLRKAGKIAYRRKGLECIWIKVESNG